MQERVEIASMRILLLSMLVSQKNKNLLALVEKLKINKA